jgi:DNA-binding transcriptional ArsR family regulator
VILDADIEHRARVLSERGAEAVIGDLHEEIRWSNGDVLVWPRSPGRDDGDVVMSGQGMVLSPNVFGWPNCSGAARPTGAASLRYPARGVGTLWERRAEPPVEALSELLGPTRAGILLALADLCDTPTLARRLGVTPGAVSQHLSVLRRAGLVRTQKAGRSAVHLRTPRADVLLDLDQPGLP